MRKTFFICMLIFMFCDTSLAASDIEDTFKEKMKYYNREIKLAMALAANSLKNGYLAEYDELKNRQYRFIAKRNDLKIRVYEIMKKAPAWWVEPEKEDVALQKK